ncbi:uncharacterized protein C8A04DRAFT_13496 [Dichotomopilus funicola]|uniref:Diphthine--ammonia ligase n=1 Tax=Dichotomopilus funicola TaxID=1934379 RepID=A0AAN6ZKT3_9PEZI|nr:hypothetical protein C8A04DRAFT_13496 [Dichotomopilus funicola]
MAPTQTHGLNVIALISGGKDSFFSLLHCRANGHQIVALANLHPETLEKLGPCDGTSHLPDGTRSATRPAASTAAVLSDPALALDSVPSGDNDGPPPRRGIGKDDHEPASLPGPQGGVPGNEMLPEADEDDRDQDLNSFMYQTVGHEVIPLYAEATGIPLYRRVITGSATQHGKDYSHHRDFVEGGSGGKAEEPASFGSGRGREAEVDETESMVPLLEAIKRAHPEANAICAGAILSTYQRTRVESVATRLGLTPLAYLWKFPVLPTPGVPDPITGSDAQLLDDMAAACVEARIIKVASGGLDDSFLWTNVASAVGKGRVARAMRRFGAAETGAVIGEGGEFETLVLDGPASLFKKRIVVAEKDRRPIKEGGGSVWLSLRNARLEEKEDGDSEGGARGVRIPELLDAKFAEVMELLSLGTDVSQPAWVTEVEQRPRLGKLKTPAAGRLQQWSFISSEPTSVEEATTSIVEQIRQRLRRKSLPTSAILTATVVLRRMADFPTINSIYGTLFDEPNPPSRVTISCGDTADTNIAVHLTVHTALEPGQRQGLHVQSRSYWAPANIGPYSQAISVPVASLGSGRSNVAFSSSSSGVKLVSIAGQIPLIPSSMALPSATPEKKGEEDTLPLQLSLSLQHLWRIGTELGVQWWTSAVAYFPSTSPSVAHGTKGEDQMAVQARLAGRAWSAAYASKDSRDEDEDEEDESGPDLWDKKYNPQYMTFASGSEEKTQHSLPDRSVLAGFAKPSAEPTPSRTLPVPPVFAAEVDELPRSAGVEWHAHLGIAGAVEGSVAVLEDIPVSHEGGEGDEPAVKVWHVIVESTREEGDGAEPVVVRFVQTIVAETLGLHSHSNAGDIKPVNHGEIAKKALARLGEVGDDAEPALVVRYVDATRGLETGGVGPVLPVVPCRSLWDGEGRRLAAVSVYQSVFE